MTQTWAGSHESDRAATIAVARGIPHSNGGTIRHRNLIEHISNSLRCKLSEMCSMRFLRLTAALSLCGIPLATAMVAARSLSWDPALVGGGEGFRAYTERLSERAAR